MSSRAISILYYTILYYTILYYTILYYTILYYTLLYYTILYYTILYYTILNSTTLYCNEQVVNLTRVTERFMASLLATIIGGVVDINMDMMTSTGPAEGNGLDYAVAGSSSSSASVSNTVT